ncbi:hypothetical protein, partial [Bacteroides nordii]
MKWILFYMIDYIYIIEFKLIHFVNNPINQHTTYITSMEVCTEELSFEYDHAGREVSSSLELFLASGKLGIN